MPGLVMVIPVTTPFATVAVADAPVPPPPEIVTVGDARVAGAAGNDRDRGDHHVARPVPTVAAAVATAALPTSKTGAGNNVELLSWVMSSLLLAPVSLLASRTGAGGVAGGAVMMVICNGFVAEIPPVDARTSGSATPVPVPPPPPPPPPPPKPPPKVSLPGNAVTATVSPSPVKLPVK